LATEEGNVVFVAEYGVSGREKEEESQEGKIKISLLNYKSEGVKEKVKPFRKKYQRRNISEHS